jgi:LmbE family N-acetylglucosaminyl deacetylase
VSAPLALCLSPHLDDAAFSCGGTLARLAACGWSVHVATVFTASVAAPAGFALACQTDKGLAPDVDYMALRRAEDVVAMRALGATAHWGALREAPHRGYHAAPELFAGAHVADRNTWSDVVAALGPLVAALRPALLLAPQGLGGHVDHRHVVRAVRALAAPVADAAPTPVAWYRDTPYVLRDPGATPPTVPDDGAPGPLADWYVPLDAAALSARLAACAAYGSQLGFQFGGEATMRAALHAHAEAEGAATACAAAERLDARPAAAAVLQAAVGAERPRATVAPRARAQSATGPRSTTPTVSVPAGR